MQTVRTEGHEVPNCYCTRFADYLGNYQVIPSMDFFIPWWHSHIPRLQWQDSSGSNCEWEVKGTWDIISTHGLATRKTGPQPQWESLQLEGEGFMEQWDSLNINASRWKNFENKSCFIAEAYLNNATANENECTSLPCESESSLETEKKK